MKRSQLSPLFLLLFLFLAGSSKTLEASVTIVSPSSFRVSTTHVPVSIQLSFQSTLPAGTSLSQAYLKVNGSYHGGASINGNVSTFNFSFNSSGTYSLNCVHLYSNGGKDSMSDFNFKILMSNVCGIATYNNSTGYLLNDTVAVNDSVFKRTSYWAQGDRPYYGSNTWQFMGVCNSTLYKNYNCSQINAWDATAVYANAGSLVKYNSVVYSSKYWNQNSTPAASNPDWKIMGACVSANQRPVIASVFGSDSNVLSQTGTGSIQFSFSAYDTDGSLSSVSLTNNGSPLTYTRSGTNYTSSLSYNNYGLYTLRAAVCDDELACDTLISRISVSRTMPPRIVALFPLSNAMVTKYPFASIPMEFTDSVYDLDNMVDSVFFALDGGSQVVATPIGNNKYRAFISPAYFGTHHLQTMAKDVTGDVAVLSRYFVLKDPKVDSFKFSALPLQLKMNLGIRKTFVFDSGISSVLLRNNSLAKVSVNGNQLLVDAYRHGRTGLKITLQGGSVVYIGLRVNQSDGKAPGLPEFASLGSVSEDATDDLNFWASVSGDLKNKNIDVRYIYINGGPIGKYNSWRTKERHLKFCRNSLKFGITPFFVYYNIPDGNESYETDISHARDTDYMKSYFNDLKEFVEDCHAVMGEDLFGIVLEPDFLGYCQQLGHLDPANNGSNSPFNIPTCVGVSTIASNAGNLNTLVKKINKTVNDEVKKGANIYWGWQINLWSDPSTAGNNGIMRSTDAMGWTSGRNNVSTGATNVTNYVSSAGILSNDAKFISMDKYGLDAMGYSTSITNPWWFNSDHWNNYLLYAKTVHTVSNKPVVLWQIPVGHINNSTSRSAYTGNTFNPLPNTTSKYEDPAVTYFFGDTFVVSNQAKHALLSQNLANDTGLFVKGDTIVWKEHMSSFVNAGIVNMMIGAGVGISTNGVKNPASLGAPPSDEYFQIQKMQQYYRTGITWVDTNIYHPNTLTIRKCDTGNYRLSDYLGKQTNNFFGYNQLPVQFSGKLKLTDLKLGMNYVSFVDSNSAGKHYKVLRIVRVNDTSCGKCTIRKTLNIASCVNYLTAGGKTLSSNGIYADTFRSNTQLICDTFYTINYSRLNQQNKQLTLSSCKALISPSKKYTWQNSGTYSDTLRMTTGCDTVYSIQFTRVIPNEKKLSYASCQDLVSPSKKYTWQNTGTYSDTIHMPSGCDTIYAIQFTKWTPNEKNISYSSCKALVSPSKKYNWTLSGTYKDTIHSPGSCDTLYTVHFTRVPLNLVQLNHSDCREYHSPSGRYVWRKSGLYNDTIAISNGCDTLYQINLTIGGVLNVPVQINDNIISTTLTQGTYYQWNKCLDNNTYQAIMGANSAVYTLFEEGQYALFVKQDSCSGYSACYTYKKSDLKALKATNAWTVYPNPGEGRFTLRSATEERVSKIDVLNTEGKQLKTIEGNSDSDSDIVIDLWDFPDAVYVLKIEDAHGVSCFIRICKLRG